MKRTFLLLALIMFSACSMLPQETGVLAGHVTIGPLQPVVREGVPEPTPGPEVYAAYKILVLSQDGRREITRLSIGPSGDYETILPVGHYLVDVAGDGIARGVGLPREIEILSGQISRLDIDIDTGIR